jgi:hypothetical protein
LAKVEDKRYIRCSAGASAEILGSNKATIVGERASDFNRKHGGWIYEISEWSANKLTKKASDLLEDEKKEAAPGEANEPSSASEGADEPAEGGQAG